MSSLSDLHRRNPFAIPFLLTLGMTIVKTAMNQNDDHIIHFQREHGDYVAFTCHAHGAKDCRHCKLTGGGK